MNSASNQGQDSIPGELARDFGDLFYKYLPGWPVAGEYNFNARP